MEPVDITQILGAIKDTRHKLEVLQAGIQERRYWPEGSLSEELDAKIEALIAFEIRKQTLQILQDMDREIHEAMMQLGAAREEEEEPAWRKKLRELVGEAGEAEEPPVEEEAEAKEAVGEERLNNLVKQLRDEGHKGSKEIARLLGQRFNMNVEWIRVRAILANLARWEKVAAPEAIPSASAPSVSENEELKKQRKEAAIPLLGEGKTPTEVATILTQQGIPTKPRQVAIINAGRGRHQAVVAEEKNPGVAAAPPAVPVRAWSHLNGDHAKVLRAALLTESPTSNRIEISRRCDGFPPVGAVEPLLKLGVRTLLTILQAPDVDQMNATERDLRSEIRERFGDGAIGEIRNRIRDARIVVSEGRGASNAGGG